MSNVLELKDKDKEKQIKCDIKGSNYGYKT